MGFYFSNKETKEDVFRQVEDHLTSLELSLDSQDQSRPWGGAFYISQSSIKNFVQRFFPELSKDTIYKYGELLRPKILIVAPNHKLSWQYHHRRAEVWKNLGDGVGIIISPTDKQPGRHTVLKTGGLVEHGPLTRHRLVGLDNWGVLAEIWQHTNPELLSDEDDIIRLEDNYGRA
jgi:mannose-6-phosphate isomerase